MSRRSTNGGASDDTGRMVTAAFPAQAGVDLGNAEPVEASHLQPAVEQLAHHFIKKGRKSSAILIVGLTAIFGGGGYFAQQAAVDRHNTEIEQLSDDVDVHSDLPGHSGAVSHEQLEKVEQQVIDLDRNVVKIGEKLDGEAVRQRERHDDLKEELRYLRRRRRDP